MPVRPLYRPTRSARSSLVLLAGLGLVPLVQAETATTKEGPAGVSVGTVKLAKSAWDAGDWIGVDLSASIDVPHFSAPTGTRIKNDPNVLGAFELRLLRNSVFVWTYKRTGETTYDFVSHGVRGYVGAYARIDSYRVQQKNAEQTIGISADRVFGLKAGMVY
jgi:hypothetical protein